MLLRTFISVLLALHGVQAAGQTGGLTVTSAGKATTALSNPLTSGQRTLTAVRRPPALNKKKRKPPPPKRRPPPPKRRPPPPKKKPIKKPAPIPQVVLPSPPPARPDPAPTPVPSAPFPCTLNINGAAISFTTCFETRSYSDAIGVAYYSLEGSALKVGFRCSAAEAQWVSWAYLPNGGMITGQAIFAQVEGGSVTQAAYQMNGYTSALFAPAAVDLKNVLVGRDGDVLAGVAEMAWPEGETEITVSMAFGSMGGGRLQVHRFIPRVYELTKKTLRHAIPPEI